ncbi:MAG: hypothetical protein ACLT8E_02085 [Akkermansia sp.]
MKKTLSLLAVTLLGISGGHAAVTLVSGFSRFDQTSPDSGTAVPTWEEVPQLDA